MQREAVLRRSGTHDLCWTPDQHRTAPLKRAALIRGAGDSSMRLVPIVRGLCIDYLNLSGTVHLVRTENETGDNCPQLARLLRKNYAASDSSTEYGLRRSAMLDFSRM